MCIRDRDPAACLKSLTLPSVAIAFGSAAVLIRYVKVSVMEQERQDYVKTAQSKGVPSRRILNGHVLRNSLIPVSYTHLDVYKRQAV